jgi:hypothetical protein
MSTTKGKPHDLTNRAASDHQTRVIATMGAVATAGGAVVMVCAFAMIPDPSLRIWAVSAAGLLIGGSR